MKNKKNKLFYGLLLLSSALSFLALGYPPNVYAILGAWCLWLLCWRLNRWLFLGLFSLHSFVCVIMLPETEIYGGLSLDMVYAFLETNPSEAVEYLTTVPAMVWAKSVGFFVLSLATLWASKQASKQIIHSILLCLIVLGTVMYRPISLYRKNETPKIRLMETRVATLGVYFSFVDFTKQYYQLREKLNQHYTALPTWQIQAATPKYQNYVLIVGESMRADYTSAYGYPLDTTPFLRQTKGVIFDNYISAGSRTVPALWRELYYQMRGNDNIISLAKQAKFETFWLSNQGAKGIFDNVAAYLGKQADQSFFTKKFSFNLHKKLSDMALLTPFQAVLNQPNSKKQPRLFVLHLMGSHQNFCDRVAERTLPETRIISKSMTCYLESLKQTDEQIRQIVQMLKNKGETYSLIYFSDHGLSRPKTGDLTLVHGEQFKQNYRVPFIKISSDDTARTHIQTARSGFRLMAGLANWLGIDEPQLLADGQTFWTDTPDTKPIEVFSGAEKNPLYEMLDDDPAILPDKP